ncbi:hypothetical protein [Pseudomonas sp. B33.4]|uniref:hypothetical protein n=1 Tax=Pseudomonas sp. B33.4 TaxID=3104265 RepID=UPI002ADEE524|nr:hypothetical protein [Pseudomonas sp. B33.4]
MNKDLRKKATRAIGHFALNVNENNEGCKPVPTSRLTLDLSTDQFYVAGFADKNLDSQGADIYIFGKIEANKTYLFESEGARGNYNPANFESSSWSSRSGSGEIKIDEIDWENKTAKGSFFFTATSQDGSQSAEINGNFNLQQ